MTRIALRAAGRPLAAAAFLALAACGGTGPLPPVPAPDLSSLEPAVQAEMRQARSAFDAGLRDASSDATRAQVYGKLGMRYHAQALREPARVAYEDAQRLAPEDARWPYYLGMVERDAGQLDAAIANAARAVKLEPANAAARLLEGQLLVRANRADEAITVLQPAMGGARAAAAAALGKAQLAKGDYVHAAANLREALDLSPTASRLHQPLAMAYRGQGDLAGAEKELALHNERGAEPTYPDPRGEALQELMVGARNYLALGERAAEAGQYDQAQKNFERAVAAEPGNKDARVNLGVIYTRAGRLVEARDQFAAAVKAAPDDAQAHYDLGMVYDRLGLDADAATEYRRVLELDPKQVKAHYFLAQVLARSGHADAGIDLYRWIVQNGNSDPEVPMHMAMAQAHAGHYADARRTLEQSLAHFGKQGGLWDALARVLATAPDAATRDPARAVAMAQELFSVAREPEYAQTLAMALAANGRHANAVEVQRAIIDHVGSGADPATMRVLRENLARYESGRTAAEAWPADSPVFRPVIAGGAEGAAPEAAGRPAKPAAS